MENAMHAPSLTLAAKLLAIAGGKAQERPQMPTQARLCPFCRGLNSAGERRCYRCGRPLPGPLASGALRFFAEALGGEALVTRVVLGLNLLVFALCIASDRRLPLYSDQFSMWTTLRFGALVGPLGSLQPWRYLAAVFVHYNVVHLAMNGLSFRSVGPSAERQFGKARFAVLFLLSGALGFVVSSLWYNGMSPPTAGASGAVFGTFGSVIGVAYARRDPNWKQVLLENIVWVVILAFMGPVNNAAHAGGLATGAVLGFLFSKEPRKLKLDPVFALLAGLLLLLSVASVALSAASPVWRSFRSQEMSREY
jgi:membrane associated rhomboid family serine protease